jgi:hypothetical protein
VKPSLSAAALLWLFAHPAIAQLAVLHIQVIEGEGAVNAAGSRISRPLAVEVTDETGKPVEGAAVSFHLPDEGPGGNFGNGLRTDVTVTDSRGRANLHTMHLNRLIGRFEIRIVASKEQARAGTMSFQYIADAKTVAASGRAPKSRLSIKRGPLKWVVLAAVAGGAAVAAGLAAGRAGPAAAAPSTPVAAASTTTTGAVTISIGSPSLTVGKP